MPTWAFAGDSITDADRGADPLGFGHGFVRRIADRAGDAAEVINAGVGGDRAVDLLGRWQRDAARKRLNFGDVWH